MARPCIAVLGTCDTKLDETLFLRHQITKAGDAEALLIDVGRTPVQNDEINVTNLEVAARGSAAAGADDAAAYLAKLSRAEYIKYIIGGATSLVEELYQKGQIHGIVSAAGSSGTSLATAVMRSTALPIGFPKLMVSTMASGDVKHLVEETDITLMYSVVDIAGTNSILNQILTNAAGAIAGAAAAYHQSRSRKEQSHTTEAADEKKKKRVAITMFGVTTPCVDTIRSYLESKYAYEVYVFHATGSGGRAMERLVQEKQLDAVLDLTTTEIPDQVVGGVLSAGPQRLRAAAQAGIPQVVSVGACDMVNFGPKNTVPPQFTAENNRLLYEHNPAVTLMRTTPEECTQIGEFIASALRDHAVRPDLVKVLLPTGGVSMIATPSQPFYSPESDAALFDTITRGLDGSGVEVRRDDRAINDKDFALFAAESLVEVIRKAETAGQ